MKLNWTPIDNIVYVYVYVTFTRLNKYVRQQTGMLVNFKHNTKVIAIVDEIEFQSYCTLF